MNFKLFVSIFCFVMIWAVLQWACTSVSGNRLPAGSQTHYDNAVEKTGSSVDYSFVVIDGCEYIADYQGHLCHKANCKNTWHLLFKR